MAILSVIWTAKGIDLTILREGVGDRRVKEQKKDAPAHQWYQETHEKADERESSSHFSARNHMLLPRLAAEAVEIVFG